MLATLEIAGWSRYLRSMLLEAMGQDYIRTARAKGLARAKGEAALAASADATASYIGETLETLSRMKKGGR